MSAENDYVSMLEMFINKLYTDTNHGFFGLTAFQAEKRTEEDMMYLGYNTEMVNKALVDTMNKFKSKTNAPLYRLKCFVNDMLSKPHKDYENYYATNFRFVLTLILGYLGKRDTGDIMLCREPKIYFKSQIDHTPVSELCKALNKTRSYVESSNDSNLADGVRMVEQWFEELIKENIPPTERKPYCKYCFNSRIYEPSDEEVMSPFYSYLTDKNDFSSCSVGHCYDKHRRFMISSGNGMPVKLEFEMFDSSNDGWYPLGVYYPKFCPECGRRLNEYEKV